MIVAVRFDTRTMRHWHVRLLERLSLLPGITVVILPAMHPTQSLVVEPLLRFEAALRRSGTGSLASRVAADASTSFPAATCRPDLVIDLAGDATGPSRLWRLVVDGEGGEDALRRSAVLGRSPLVELHEGDAVLARGRVGTENRGQLIESLEDALARTITLIAATLAGHPPRMPAEAAPAAPPHLTIGRAAGVAAMVAARRLRSRLHRLAYRTPHWRVGWRRYSGADLLALGHHPRDGWRDLPDDGQRFYADPFPIERNGLVTLFVEDYPHATGRGIISAVGFGPHGPLGCPEPVLERPYHLSYPFVFERDGETWMIPESAGAGTIDLFRATRFPGGWVREATLVSGLEAGDATLHESDGRWWMFATVRDGGASSDALYLWSAPDFRGPWQAHAKNPVLIDIASARPAGRMSWRDGRLVRPVQDCRGGYGAALGLATVTQLDHDGFAQRVDTVVTPGPRWRGLALHTVNTAGGFEFIDGSGRASRLPRFRSAPDKVRAADGLA